MTTLEAKIPVGTERIIVKSDDQEEFHKLVHLYREMSRNVEHDAYIRVRKQDDYTYPEFYSPSLKAAKKVSSATKANRLVGDAPYYIGFQTPWVRFIRNKEGGMTQLLMFDYITDELREKGFTDYRVWYMGHTEDGEPVKDNDDFSMTTTELKDYLRG